MRLLAWKGAKVYFTTRSEAKALEARKRIQDAYPDIEPDNLQYMTLDVADLRSITSVADKLMEKERKVDVLSESRDPLYASPSSPGRGLMFILPSPCCRRRDNLH